MEIIAAVLLCILGLIGVCLFVVALKKDAKRLQDFRDTIRAIESRGPIRIAKTETGQRVCPHCHKSLAVNQEGHPNA